MLHDPQKMKNAITEESDYEANREILHDRFLFICKVSILKLASVNQASIYALILRLSLGHKIR